MRREILVSIILLLAVIAGSFYFLSTYQKKDVRADLSQGLPPQTVLALSASDLDRKVEILLEFEPMAVLSGDTSFYSISSELKHLRGALGTDSTMSFQGIVSLARVSSNALGVLFLIDKGLLAETQRLEDGLSPISDGMYELQLSDETYYVSENENAFSISKHLGLVESSKESFLSDSENLFHDEVKAKSEFLMLNYASLNWLLPGGIDLEKLKIQKKVKNLQGIGVYEFSSTANGLTLMGAITPSSLNSTLNPKHYSDPRSIQAFDVLPEKVPMFSASTGLRFVERLLAKSSDSSLSKGIDSFNMRNGVDLVQDFVSSLGSEMVFGLQSAFDHRIESTSYLMVNVTDQETLALFLEALDSSYGHGADSLIIGSTKETSFLKWVFDGVPLSGGNLHFALFNDYLVMAGAAPTINDLYQDVESGNVFSQSEQYALMSDWIKHESNQFVYVNPALCYALPFEITHGEMANWYPRNIASLKGMDVFASQLVKNNNRFFNHIYAHKAEQVVSEQVVQWTRSISSEIDFGPFLVSNYVTKKNEVLVGDTKGVLSLIDQNGRVKWTFDTKEELLSAPVEIDAYKNNKIQYLLSGAKSLHLLDRKGNRVTGYPIRIPSRISGEPTVFDLKGTKEYSLMVPSEDAKVYGYTANGRPIPGWSPKELGAKALGSLQYFNKSRTDYYLLSDVAGTIYTWKTDGKDAVTPIPTGTRLVSNLTIRFGPSLEQCKVVAFDSLGNLVTAGLDGVVKKVLIDKNLSDAQGFWVNIDESAQKELIVYKGRKIKVVQQNGRITSSITLEAPVEGVQMLEDNEGRLLIAAVLPNKLVFHDADGSLVLEVPVDGCNGVLSLDDFTDDGLLDLVTSTKNEVILIKNIF